jgi:large subunit ribosomal protein L35
LVTGVSQEASAGLQDRKSFCGRLQEQFKRSAKKRFRVRPGGTVKRGQAFKRHILTKKSTKNKRHLRGAVTVHETNMAGMAQMLPFAGL